MKFRCSISSLIPNELFLNAKFRSNYTNLKENTQLLLSSCIFKSLLFLINPVVATLLFFLSNNFQFVHHQIQCFDRLHDSELPQWLERFLFFVLLRWFYFPTRMSLLFTDLTVFRALAVRQSEWRRANTRNLSL